MWHTGVAGKKSPVCRAAVIGVAREFADTAAKTRGRSMIIVGAGMNHWFHNDMNYRGLINMLVMWLWANRWWLGALCRVKKNCDHKPVGSRWRLV